MPIATWLPGFMHYSNISRIVQNYYNIWNFVSQLP